MENFIKIDGSEIDFILAKAENVLNQEIDEINAKIDNAKVTVKHWIFFKREISLKENYLKNSYWGSDWRWDKGRLAHEIEVISEREKDIVELKDIYETSCFQLGSIPFHKGECYLTRSTFDNLENIKRYIEALTK